MKNANHHLLWIIAVLVAAIIWNFSITWGSANELVSALSLAMGLTSLVVGVYAIFQALFSSKSISDVTRDLKFSADTVAESALRVENASSELRSGLNTLPDQVALRLERSQSAPAPDVKPEKPPSTKWRPKGAMTMGGWVAAYGCVRSSERGIAFSPTTIFENMRVAEYVNGFIGSFKANGQIDYEKNGYDEYSNVELKDIDPDFVKEKIKSLLKSSSSSSSSDYIKKYTELFDKHFSSDLNGGE